MINALGQCTIFQGHQSLITNQFSILIRSAPTAEGEDDAESQKLPLEHSGRDSRSFHRWARSCRDWLLLTSDRCSPRQAPRVVHRRASRKDGGCSRPLFCSGGLGPGQGHTSGCNSEGQPDRQHRARQPAAAGRYGRAGHRLSGDQCQRLGVLGRPRARARPDSIAE